MQLYRPCHTKLVKQVLTIMYGSIVILVQVYIYLLILYIFFLHFLLYNSEQINKEKLTIRYNKLLIFFVLIVDKEYTCTLIIYTWNWSKKLQIYYDLSHVIFSTYLLGLNESRSPSNGSIYVICCILVQPSDTTWASWIL